MSQNRFQRDIDHWNETGRCLRHFSLDTPPLFCEQCGKDWKAVVDGRKGRRRRREAAAPSSKTVTPLDSKGFRAAAMLPDTATR